MGGNREKKEGGKFQEERNRSVFNIELLWRKKDTRKRKKTTKSRIIHSGFGCMRVYWAYFSAYLEGRVFLVIAVCALGFY